MEQQHCSVGAPATLQQVQAPQQRLCVIACNVIGHATPTSRLSQKGVHGLSAQVLHPHVRHGHAVPGPSLSAQKEGIEANASQKLVRGAGPQVVASLAVDGKILRLDAYLEKLPAVFPMKLHIGDDPECGDGLVGDILKQTASVLDPHHLTVIGNAYVDGAATGIGKPTEPLQVLIAPNPPCTRYPSSPFPTPSREHATE